eukprot:10393904-Karenia_brevis.AAC.1
MVIQNALDAWESIDAGPGESPPKHPLLINETHAKHVLEQWQCHVKDAARVLSDREHKLASTQLGNINVHNINKEWPKREMSLVMTTSTVTLVHWTEKPCGSFGRPVSLEGREIKFSMHVGKYKVDPEDFTDAYIILPA